MKKLFSFSLAVTTLLLGGLLFAPSCKKVWHATNPTPSNFKLLGYTKIITKTMVAPIMYIPAVTETYSFGYDGNNRLSQILYATNDSNMKKLGLLDLRITFDYSADSIIKTIYNLKAANIVEQDTFIQNAYGQIIFGNFLKERHTYTYAGSLLASQTDTYLDSGTTVSGTSFFTSDNKDFLHQAFNGSLTATFPNIGIRPDITPAFPQRDSILSYPLTVVWNTFDPYISTTTHNSVGVDGVDQTDILTGYHSNGATVDAYDANGIFVRTGYFPAGLYTTKFFQIYDFFDDRVGDYMQLQSFTTYGVNIYHESHLVKQMTSTYDTTFVTYNIDAQSKITQTQVLIKDIKGNSTSIIYKLTYDTN